MTHPLHMPRIPMPTPDWTPEPMQGGGKYSAEEWARVRFGTEPEFATERGVEA